MKKYLIPAIIAGAVLLVGVSSVASFFVAKAQLNPEPRIFEKTAEKDDGTITSDSGISSEKDDTKNAENNNGLDAEQKDGCLIKGNISSSGEKIYHVPGGSSYEKTKIDTSKGEKWFCTEDEAVAAGWRKAKR